MANASERLAAAVADRYAVERELGSGGMATVYLARDLKHGRKVAIKVLRPELAAALGADRFAREIEIAANLTHPHILPLFDSGEAGGFLYYVMPYVAGESLRDRLNRESRLSVQDAIRLTDQIASALAYAHEQGVVHRDIKPENILLAGDQAIVADFGIARAVEAAGGEKLTGTGLAIGTPAYMSPEQAFSQAVDGRTDVYALGCVVYEMLSGRTPFEAPTPQALLAKHAADTVPQLRASDPGAPLFVERAVARALAKNPLDRFPTASAFAEALTSGTVVARVRGRPGPRLRLVVAGIIAVLVGAGWYVVGRPRAPAVPGIAVAPLEDRTGDPRLAQVGDLAADWITRGLTRVESLDVTAARVARDVWLATRDAPEEQVRTLAERTGSTVIVSGTYSLDGDQLRMAAEVIDARNGRLIVAIDPVIDAGAAPNRAVATLAERVTGAVAAHVGRPAAEPAFTSPPTLEAFREYQEGMDAASRSDWRASIVHYRRAIAIDSTYPPPALWAATAYANLGQSGTADTLLHRVHKIVDRLAPIERINFEWLWSIIHGDPVGRLRWAEEGYRLDPRRWAFPLGITLLRANEPRRALEVLRQYDRSTPFGQNWDPYWEAYGEAQHALGDFRGELRTAARLRASSNRRFTDLAIELRALAGLGRTNQVEQLLDASVSLPSEGQGTRRRSFARLVVTAAGELRAHGYGADAALDRLLGGPVREMLDEQDARWLAQGLYLAGRWSEAWALYDSLHRHDPDELDYVGWVGVTHARMGERAAALAIDSALAAFSSGHVQISRSNWGGRPNRWRARIAATLGDRQRAIGLLQLARTEGMLLGFDLHAEMDFEPLRDHAAFREMAEPQR